MTKIRSILLCALVLPLSACAGRDWQRIYAGGKTMATFIDETHESMWSDPLNERLEVCSAQLPEVTTNEAIDECLGVYANNPKVVEALEAYNASAKLLSAVLLATDPEAKDKRELQAAWREVIARALEMLELLPESDKLTRQLRALTGGQPWAN